MKTTPINILILLLSLQFLHDTSFAQAVWRGRAYYSPVCNSPNCQMCNSIRSQLYTPTPSMYLSEVGGPGAKSNTNSTKVESPPDLTKVTELVPTPEEKIGDILRLLNLSENDILIEPGCGDGRILRETSKTCLSLGIELNPETAVKARRNAPDAIVIEGNALDFNYDKATVVSMYLYPELMDKIIKLLPKGTRIVSYLHSSNNLEWQEHTIGDSKFYTGVVR